MAPRLAFLGLGQMGLPMVERLLDAGHTPRIWNRTAGKAERLAARGATVCKTAREAASHADVVFTMLSTPEVLDRVLFGPDGAAGGIAPGAALVEMSTVGAKAIAEVRARLDPAVRLADAPVLGSTPQAKDGTLKIFFGGDAALYEALLPVLRHFGTPRHVGPLGAGAGLKLVVNSTLGALMTTLGEALALGDALALDPATVLDVLSDSPISTPVKSKRAHFESGSYPPRFKLSLSAKDMRLVTEAAREAGLSLSIADAARRWIDEAEATGLGELDYSAVVAHIRKVKAGR